MRVVHIHAFEKVIKGTNGAIEVVTDADVEKLLKDKERVNGLVAKHFGEKIVVSADAVVLATGGFGSNVKLRQELTAPDD